MAKIKFGQLPPGRRFRWKNAEWLKISPILARPADGEKPVLVPRSALVEGLDGNPAETSAELPESRINLVLKDLQHKVLHRLEAASLPPDQRKELARQIDLLVEQARDQLKSLPLS
ncbi:hypothetical protein [Thiolapillus brandeum]|uniref:Uncharacterized protein n=1 Tax=Thiolapillus brandeum TaxID=1076588 RepID=A0A7U6GLA4_9GAMM|nr:hypothetical protein [Thiolapillus brandeum]BAO45736.1 hypothetical protein TBH_C2835 [Thiolapillus brandeum]